MAMKGYSAFPKALTLLESLSDILVSDQEYLLRVSYPSAEKQSVYSTAPADWAIWLFFFGGDIYFCMYKSYGKYRILELL